MTQPTVNSVHVDRPMTTWSRRYQNNAADYVARRAFPIVKSDFKSDQYYIYTPGYWFRVVAQRRTPGGDFARGGYGVETDSFLCEIFGLEKLIPDEERNNSDAPLMPDQDATEWLTDQILLLHETEFADQFMITGVWGTDNSTATDWDATGGVPITNVQVARRTIKNATGQTINTLVCGKIVEDGLATNSEILDRIKYTDRALPVDVKPLLAAALDLKQVLVSDVSEETAAEGVTSSMAPILDDDALLIYVPDSPTVKSAAAGLTFVWEGGGGIGQIERYREDRNKSDVLQIQTAYDFKQVAAALGYFLSDVV